MQPNVTDINWLKERLDAYTPGGYCNGERAYIHMARYLLASNANCLHRDCFFPGHFTGSAWVVNPSRTKTLLIRHAKLNMWIQPGGHADGNPNLLETALRELEEESGYTCAKVVDGTIFDLDIHSFPAKLKDGVLEPEHLHFDLRFLIEIDDTIPIPGSAENQTFAWLTLEEAAAATPPTNSVLRMIEKTVALRDTPAKAGAHVLCPLAA